MESLREESAVQGDVCGKEKGTEEPPGGEK